jgi:poly-gamma-glutamate capsule biosynthesis protein CapA/YwtB (metallophosphatase superfamily)
MNRRTALYGIAALVADMVNPLSTPVCLADPRELPSQINESMLNERHAQIAFGGDTLLGGYYNTKYGTNTVLTDRIDKIIKKFGVDGCANHFFKHIKHLFQDADYAIVNLEGPIGPEESIDQVKKKVIERDFPLRQHHLAADILKAVGIDCVALANNHAFDYNWEEGLKHTLKTVEGKLDYAGAGIGVDAYKPHICEVNGITVAFYSASDVLEPIDLCAKSGKIGIAGIPQMGTYESSPELGYIFENLKETKKTADFNIIYMHAGPVSGKKMNARQQELASICAENGFDVYIGMHSHAKQKIEKNGDCQVFNGIGNLVFGGRRGPQQTSTIPVIDFYIAKDGSKRMSSKTYDIEPNHNASFTPRLI